MLKKLKSKTMLLLAFTILGIAQPVKAAPTIENNHLKLHHRTVYRPNHEELLFILNHGYGFKSDHVLTDNDITISLYSSNAILVDLTSNEVIYERNSHQRTYPASLTKMMTVLVAIENKTADMMTVDVDFNGLYEEGAAIAGFQNGETVTFEDLLYGIMLPSGADAALTVAKNIAGSEAGFVELMNQKAKALGMTGTHFTNVTGLHDDNHYSTAYDMAMLVKAALYNDDFRAIYSAKSYMVSNGLVFTSRMFDRLSSPTFGTVEILGGKTGYTHEAMLCLASYATDGKHEYALVTTHANGSSYTPQYHVLDAIYAYNYFLN